MKNCSILWDQLSLEEWQSRFASIRRSNLLQSYDYARAICPINQQVARWGLIRLNGEDAGLVQFFEVGLFKRIIHMVMLDRGPLWFDGYGGKEDLEAFFMEFDRQFRPRLGRRRRIMPETELDILPFKRKLAYPAYETIWLDITPDGGDLRTRLKKNWRGSLKKAEESGLVLADNLPEKYLPWLLKHYEEDKTERGYRGASLKTIIGLCKTFAPKGNMLLLRAQKSNQDIAGILIFIHGQSATYQVGWTDPHKGRKNNAHHFLLWEAIKILKERGVKDLDLGGINDLSAKGVKKFKEGLGGEAIKLCGQFK